MKNLKVDSYLSKPNKWHNEIEQLRNILLQCSLTEEFKWGKPCYSYNGTNTIIIIPLKEHCALSFFKGVLLKDTHQLLSQPGEHSQSGRWMKFVAVEEIKAIESILKNYIYEAIEIEKSGLKVVLKKISDHPIPVEFQELLDSDATIKSAFESLTPGRQRAYLLFFGAAKQSKTRLSRIEKCIPQILIGKGVND